LAGAFDDRGAAVNIQSKLSSLTIPSPKLLVLSANDEKSLARLTKIYARHFEQINVNDEAAYLNDLAYTLNSRRSSLRCKSFLVARSRNSLRLLNQNISKPIFSMPNPKIGYIFTGQGAQWYGMGRELLLFPVFKNSLLDAQEYLKDLGCEWSLLGRTINIPLTQTKLKMLQMSCLNPKSTARSTFRN
jgi:acyl transferase domain-containing protein